MAEDRRALGEGIDDVEQSARVAGERKARSLAPSA
jgi:hypothetical protein